ncbi:MAG: polyphosphate kinase 2 (PPK2 family), partial [Urechidicola sp.]
MFLTKEDLESLKTREDVIKLAEEKNFKLEKYLWDLDYEKQLKKLQGELVNLQKWISDN